MTAAVPQIAELCAPLSWRTVDFISDLHLHASEPAPFEVWQNYMQTTPADAVFILGDLFEVWVGDDAVGSAHPGFEDACVKVLAQTGERLPIFFMHGNRDFLIGQDMMALGKTTLLQDPTTLVFNQQRWLLSHGDALCLGDVDYMLFRKEVRSPKWQQDFLARPLAERQAIATALRMQSEARKQTGMVYADVDAACARTWLLAADAEVLIHGHTHKPAAHDLGGGLSRIVLSDWDAAAQHRRAEVLRLSALGLQRTALS